VGSPNDLLYIKRTVGKVSGSILEVGARYNTTGFKKYFTEPCGNCQHDEPVEYVGTDLEAGPDVDIVCDLTAESTPLPKNHFDLVVCCSVMEHVTRPWIMAERLSETVKPGGKLFISVPWAWRYHAYPNDYYRFSFNAIEFLYPDFVWDNFAYAGEQAEDIRWIGRGEVGRDSKWTYMHTNDDGSQKKYIPYLLIMMLGTKKDA
jgi:SAM-dependent methyltransferase